ncbi:MAG: hypothetical protein IJK84_04455 [Bacteroidales bacterium]|nr:hypothetical protein [Bacteroidales bacterium]MBQ6068734.1 hypothetical protein [Bacteroidales bacterium]
MINTATNTSKIELAVPSFVYNEADILRDILADLNNQAKHDTHRTMEAILLESPYNPKWKSIIGFEGRKFVPAIKIERRERKTTK